MEIDNQVLFVDTMPALVALCHRLKNYNWLALDTEFQREKTYFPRLCLLQAGTPDFVACIDTLVLSDLHPLLKVIYDPGITKVMHASRQDLEIFYHLQGKLPAPVFDTQVAAPLLGYPEQVGYATLVSKILGIKLDKAYTRADWTQRPLPAKQLQYAIDDVRYLVDVYQFISDELKARDRLAWLNENFVMLTDPHLYHNPPELAWQRICGAEQLEGEKLSVLQTLASWREQTAREENRPRHWLLRDEVLLELACRVPETRAELRQIRGIPKRVAHRYREQILTLIRQAKAQPPKSPASRSLPPPLTPVQEALVDCLMAIVRLRAHEQSLNPRLLASRSELQRLVLGEQELQVLRGWKSKVVGAELLALLRGECSLRIKQGTVFLTRGSTE